MSAKIEICNPLKNGMRYTSVDRALAFVRRGMAVFTADGKLEFTLENQVRRTEEQEFAHNRSGVLYWNGAKHPLAMHIPGKVRS